MSSATAAPKIVAPSLVFRVWYSFNTSTEILTEVAEKITPIKRASIGLTPKIKLAPPTRAIGKITPMTATTNAGLI